MLSKRFEGETLVVTNRQIMWVNVYETGTAFGGAEEGGWYYSYGSVTESMSFWCCGFLQEHNKDCVAYRMWEQKLLMNQKPQAYTDEYVYVAEGEDASPEYLGETVTTGVDVRLEPRQGVDYPEHRPHYE